KFSQQVLKVEKSFQYKKSKKCLKRICSPNITQVQCSVKRSVSLYLPCSYPGVCVCARAEELFSLFGCAVLHL
ncbi:AGAP011699-PA, partial [Anopheles gambiae str. PEST]